MRPSTLLATIALITVNVAANAFELTVSGPDFTVIVPNLPSIHLVAQTPETPDVTRAMAGEDEIYQVSLVVGRAERETTARGCAGSFLRLLVARPGMPDRDSIYRAPLDEDTFLVLYILGAPENRRLHAHLVSSVNARNCVEVHFSKALGAGEDEDNWRKSFLGAHIQSLHR